MVKPLSTTSHNLPASNSPILSSLMCAVIMLAASAFFWFFLPASHPIGVEWIEKLILAPALLILIWYDFREFRLPNAITYPLLLSGMTLSCFANWMTVFSAVTGAVIGYILVALIRKTFLTIRKTEGIGLGDAKLIAAAGAWFGVFALGPLLLVSSTLGLLQILLVRSVAANSSGEIHIIPFGPAIAVSIWMMSWGQFLLPLT